MAVVLVARPNSLAPGLFDTLFVAAELYMLTDTSPGKAETWDALERRLEDSMVLGKTLGRVGAQFAPLMSGIADQITALLKGTRMPKPPSGPMV